MEDEHPRCTCKLEERKVFVFVFNRHRLQQHKHDKYSFQTKGQMTADKRFSKGTWNSKLTRGEFLACVIVLRFLLLKKLVSIKTTHALYRDNGPLIFRVCVLLSVVMKNDYRN